MPDLRISEAVTVQFPMIAHAAVVGWVPVPPDVARARRGGEGGMLFREELAAALGRFNAWMSADAVRQVMEKLEALPPNIDGNREMLAWLRGDRQWYDEGERRHRRVQIIDFDRPGANDLHVTWEWKLKPPARKGNRADVLFLVNGVPVCIVEHKNPKDAGAIDRGVRQLRRYELETPELLATDKRGLIISMIHKFDGMDKDANTRDNIFVFIDEAHRSVARDLGTS